VRPASTARNAYCKGCRAAYQREWRARKKCLDAAPMPVYRSNVTPLAPVCPAEIGPRVRLRGTPTRAELLRYRLT
jgi:hypothetical protein